MTPRRRLVTLSASLALHAGLLLAVLLAVSGETDPGAAGPRGHRRHRGERSRSLGRRAVAVISRRRGRMDDRRRCPSSSWRAWGLSRRRARRESRFRARGAGWWWGRRGWPRSRVRRLSRKAPRARPAVAA